MHLIRQQQQQPRAAAGVPSRQEALTQKSPKVTQSVSIVTPTVLIMVCVQPVPVQWLIGKLIMGYYSKHVCLIRIASMATLFSWMCR